jgi:hypothetical protein
MNTKIYFFLLLTSFTLCFAVEPPNFDYINIKVKKGESISLIYINYYGYYSKELEAIFKIDNPEIKDINVIFPEQTLRFRLPRPAKTNTLAINDSLLVKKIAMRQGIVICIKDATMTIRGLPFQLSQSLSAVAPNNCPLSLLTKTLRNVTIIWIKIKKLRDKISRLELECPNRAAGVHG